MSSDVIVVDENDNFIRNAPRKLVHASTEWHRGVHSFLFNEDGDILLLLRSANKDKFPLHWECAISEHVDPGESYLQALRRGIREELGIEPPELKRVAKFRCVYGEHDHTVAELYKGTVSGDMAINKEEVQEAKFVPVRRVKESLDKGKYTPWFKELFRFYEGMGSKLTVMD
jgi:isopentenyl-diphosphate delta-isomerase